MNALRGNRTTRHRTCHGWKTAPPACFQNSEAGPHVFLALRKMAPVAAFLSVKPLLRNTALRAGAQTGRGVRPGNSVE